MRDDIHLRPATDQDLEFLYAVYASSRAAEMTLVPWDEAQKAAFLTMQFQLQHQYYHQQFGGARFDIIELAGEPVGRLYVDERPDEVRIIDIALLEPYRGQGIGSQLLQNVLARGQDLRRPVRIHVEKNNPALHLYDRLQFHVIEDQGVYFLMEWVPEEPAQKGT
jgi:ribosomal protein S18 acetylase RimI-like enzyme